MATNIAEIPSEDIDSRTATFERNRPYDVATRDDSSNAGSAESTPRKRKKHAAKLGYPDPRDLIPNDGSFRSDSAPLEKPPNGEMSTAPPMNWNAVNNTKVRISLGGGQGNSKTFQGRRPQAIEVVGGPGKTETRQDDKVQTSQAVDSPERVDIAQHIKPQTNLKPKAARKEATKVALARLEGFRERLARMDPHDGPVSAYEAAQAEVEDAEVDYNYCLYYPLGPPFSPPPPKLYVPEDGDMAATEGKKYQLWEQTKECMQEGTLQDLKEGRITWGTGPPAQASDIKQISRRLRYLAMGYADVAMGERLRKPTEEEMRPIHLDLKYCKYFPSNEEYLPLHRAKKGLENPNNFSGGNGDLNRRAAQIWKLVQQCEADGTLESLMDGQIEQCIRNVPAATQSCLASELRVAKAASRTETGSEDEAAEDMTITNGFEGEVEIPNTAGLQSAKAASQLADTKENGEITPSQIHMVELSPEPERAPRISQNGSSSDEGLVLNTYEDERLDAVEPRHIRVAGEIIEEPSETDSNQASMNDRTAPDGNDSTTDADSDSEDGNGIMDDEDSEHAAEDAVRELENMPDSEAAQTLADLNPHDLNAQIRYFHFTKQISDVDRKTPVRCLVCSSQGHMAGVCDQLTCKVCGVFNHHTTKNCPSTAKCSKCRELGHDKEHCLYKLKHLVQNEILCDLCQRNGHIEENCELQWRTSGRPWDFNLNDRNVRLSCYECGHSGHLGNDCSTRRPGKQLGSSSWGSGDNHISIKSKGEISIRGTARYNPIDIDDADEMARAFIRPKVPEPIRKGKIHIKTGPKSTLNDLGPYSGWKPVNAPYINGSANESSHGHYQDDERQNNDYGAWQAAYDHPGYGSHGQSNRRSHSPEYRDHDGYDYSDRYNPPAPRPTHQGSRPMRGADLFRPMPSSALNAWSRHRV